MNQTIFSLLKKQILLIVIILLLSFVIWFRGPEWDLNGLSPLSTTEQRLYAILFMVLLWLLKFIFLDTNPKKLAPKGSPEVQKKMERLQGHFSGALQFLKKTIIQKQDKKINLLSLPWFLIIGPENSGKTTLLANSNINFILAKPAKSLQKKMTSSDITDWWVTRDLVLVDTPGGYLLSKTKNGTYRSTLFHLLWRHLIFLVHKYRKKHLQGVVIALNLPEIIRNVRQYKNQMVYDLRKRIHELLETFGKDLPIHLVITKCDLLPGFVEFFSESTTDEIAQSFGITLPILQDNENIHDMVTERFNALIKRLNKHLITRLHHERDITKRPFIKDFPLHIEHLKEHIGQLLKALAQSKLPLRSIHLTSGAQPREEAHATILSENAGMKGLAITPPPVKERAYFIKQFILQTLLATNRPSPSKEYHRYILQRRIIYATAVTLVLTAGYILGRDFQQGLTTAHDIQNHLAAYQVMLKNNPSSEHLTVEGLTLLNALKKASTQTPNATMAFYSNRSQLAANKVYEEALSTIVLPEIKNYLERFLRNPQQKKAENLYPVLKAYIMLGDEKHFDAEFIAKTLSSLLPLADKQKFIELSHHIKAALNTKTKVKLDNVLINQMRKGLLELPKVELAFILLKNMDDNNVDRSIELGAHPSNTPILVSKAIVPQIPEMYTEKAFSKIISQQINQAVDEIYEGNWVLGGNTFEPNDAEIIELTTDVHTQYIAKYVDIWESLLANIQIVSPKNLGEMENMIAILTSHQSPLLQLLHTIQKNTAFAPVLDASPKLQTLSVLLTDGNKSDLYDIFVSLKKLHQELKTMHTPEAIFTATVKRTQVIDENDSLIHLRTIGEKTPEPLKTWLLMIAKDTWIQMLKETSDFIEAKYQTEIMPVYRTQILNHYPFNPTSLVEVDLTHFTNFFSQPGYLSQFYKIYLKPFLDESGKTWKVVDNQTIPLNNGILAQYERAERLQHAFFPNGDNKLYVTFSLQPVALDKNLKGLTLNINGQELQYEKNHEATPRLLSWPGNQTYHATSLNFILQNNQLQSHLFEGNWGWFRLVNSATESIRSHKELLLNFDVNGYSAKYILFTEGKLNPFLPINISRFDLPEHLSG